MSFSVHGFFQCLVAGVLCFAASLSAAQQLSESETVYLASQNPVSLCVDPDWWPFETINTSGQHVGISADLLDLVAKRLGMQFKLHQTRTWEESLVASQAGNCRLMSFLNRTPERERWLIFTEPLLSDPNVLITREEHPFIANLSTLSGKTMALPRGTAMMERLRVDYPHLILVGTESEAEALKMVSERKADMTLRSLIVAAHTIKQHGWFNLKISGQIPGYDNQLRVGVLQSETVLRDLLDKGIATLTAEDRSRVVDHHVSINVVTQVDTDYTLVLWLLALLAAVALTSLVWMRRLHQLNAQLRTQSQTDLLTGLLNRHGLARSFALDVERAQRYLRPLSVLMLDIDHFKRINDGQGHLMGDKVLVELARVIQATVRQVDTVCRWGGEEFVVVCHETTGEQAAQQAERLLQCVRQHAFAHGQPVTISAGVATVRSGDSVETLLARADGALYQAKTTGRDRVCDEPPQS
ncbi:periplasmic/7TM domain sensor diguanylate cyclase [Acidovorax sp. 69]|nr:periplasmic/7TM domain sensor diguanylate cyclase [Acidovorax sp. 69]